MFAKGPIPGWSPKTECLEIHPNAVCKRKTALGISGYLIHLDEKVVCAAISAKEAWAKFWCKLVDEGKINRKFRKDT